MSKGQMLRALVSERLAAAAEDIFVLFERTIAAYEEELCRSKEENQRKQQLLDKLLNPRMEWMARGNVHIPTTSLKQASTETPHTKEKPEEQSVKREEEQLPAPVPESSCVHVKTEESSLLHQRETKHREETQGEDISSEPHFLSETEGQTELSSNTDNDDNWELPFSWSAAQMETEAVGDHFNQVQIRDRSTKLSSQNKSAPETTVHNEQMSGADSGADRGAGRRKHECPFCQKRFGAKQTLQTHIRVHTGEKPYGCPICKKTFTQKSSLNLHIRLHTGEKPFGCSFCKKTFAQKCNLKAHMMTHQGSKLQPENMFG